MKKFVLASLTLLASVSTFPGAPSANAQEPGNNLRIGLVTMGPGSEIWEKFGHNAILVEDTVSGTSRWYNYGMFSFRQENFLLNFIQGRMNYWMAARDPQADLFR